jgi:hypothetical protein
MCAASLPWVSPPVCFVFVFRVIVILTEASSAADVVQDAHPWATGGWTTPAIAGGWGGTGVSDPNNPGGWGTGPGWGPAPSHAWGEGGGWGDTPGWSASA